MPVVQEFKLADKVALVAGDGTLQSNIFTPVLAEALAEAGARLFVVARRNEVVEGGGPKGQGPGRRGLRHPV